MYVLLFSLLFLAVETMTVQIFESRTCLSFQKTVVARVVSVLVVLKLHTVLVVLKPHTVLVVLYRYEP